MGLLLIPVHYFLKIKFFEKYTWHFHDYVTKTNHSYGPVLDAVEAGIDLIHYSLLILFVKNVTKMIFSPKDIVHRYYRVFCTQILKLESSLKYSTKIGQISQHNAMSNNSSDSCHPSNTISHLPKRERTHNILKASFR